MAYRLFLFDLDGTLVDTSPGILEALRRMEQELGIAPLPQKTLEKFIGRTLDWSIETYYGNRRAVGQGVSPHLRRGRLHPPFPPVPLYSGVAGADPAAGRQKRRDLPEDRRDGDADAGCVRSGSLL